MWSLFSEFTRDIDSAFTVMVMDEDGLEQPRRYRVVPRKVLAALVGTMVAVTLLVLSLVVFTPLRELIPGYGTAEMRQHARLNSLRLTALQDSLRAQQRYMTQIRQLMMGQVDSAFVAEATGQPPEQKSPQVGEVADAAANPVTDDWTDHEQPALPVTRMPVQAGAPFRLVASETKYLASLQLPVMPPVDGFLTRGFDARTGHYAVDIAVEEGTMVRCIGDGYVVMADWTHEGGYTLAVQHADGYVSVYKHNQRLLKRVGERVRAREAIAMSGNSGEISTGPHLHFELWHDGLAQDPRFYFIGH